MSDTFDDEFADLASEAFADAGLSAWNDAVHVAKSTGVQTENCRVQANRNVEFAGDESQVPQRVTTLDVVRTDVAKACIGDTFSAGGYVWTIDSDVRSTSGAYDTYVVLERRA